MRSASRLFTQDVLLIKDKEGDCVQRDVLHDEGRIANMVDFDTSRNEEIVRQKSNHVSTEGASHTPGLYK